MLRYLFQKRRDYIIDYEIENQKIIDSNIAFVTAKVRRYGLRADDNYRYRYRLEKSGRWWYVISIDATVLMDR